MKLFIICLLLKKFISLYTSEVVEYARTWCNKMNPEYNNYGERAFKETGNFASQCLYAGGQSFSGCKGKDNKGMIPDINDLMLCLTEKKGWIYDYKMPPSFKPGYLVVGKGLTSPLIVTDIKDNNIFYCRHNYYKCDEIIDANSVNYYYPKN